MFLWPASTLSWPLLLVATLTVLADVRPALAFTYTPVAEPLVVKSPFLSTWNSGSQPLAGSWAFNAADLKITAWEGLARVDGVTYNFVGDGSNGTVLIGKLGLVQSISITPTQSIFVVKCGGVDITVSFLSPIEPTDFVRMSLPFSYMAVTAAPNDGASHSVQIYSDLSAEWLSDVTNVNITWSTQMTSTMVYHQFALSNPTDYATQAGRAQYGTAYHGTLLGNKVTYQTAADIGMRSGFNWTGTLNNTQDTAFRQIGDQWPCFGLAKDLGMISSASDPVVFVMGLTRDPAVSYQVSSGPQPRSLYFRTQFNTDQDALSFFLNDYATALASANTFDSKVTQAATQISPNYVDLVTLAARQTFSSVEVTVPMGSDGRLNSSDPLLFMGPFGVNEMDTIYATSPFWAWVNPALLRLLLGPTLNWHRNLGGSKNYVVDDLGDTYPLASGPSSSALNTPKSLESTADMMIVTSAFVRVTGDTSIVSENADLYQRWGDYLKENSLYPGTQQTTDDEVTGSTTSPINNTNLAVKGFVALKAYADILDTLGQNSSTYSAAATSYATTWQSLAATSSGYSSSYGDPNSWSLLYNVFVDKWLDTGLFPSSVFQKLSSQYGSHANKFGVPFDSDTTTTSAQWMVFAAGLVPDTQTRDLLISKAQFYIQNGPDRIPWASSFETIAGNATAGTDGRPSVGGVYALLVLNQTVVTSPTTSPGHSGAMSTLSLKPINLLAITSALLFALIVLERVVF